MPIATIVVDLVINNNKVYIFQPNEIDTVVPRPLLFYQADNGCKPLKIEISPLPLSLSLSLSLCMCVRVCVRECERALASSRGTASCITAVRATLHAGVHCGTSVCARLVEKLMKAKPTVQAVSAGSLLCRGYVEC
jgi:hypothetical protein